MEAAVHFLNKINLFLWAGPMLVLLSVTHLFFTVRLKFVQKYIFRSIRLSLSSGSGSFRTLTATLAATLGTGNIVGISTAVALGGAGAVFWCWLTGVFGMATTYAECYLGSKYRTKRPDGTCIAGPMVQFEHGLNSRFLAVFYALCLLLSGLGMCCTTSAVLRQVSSPLLLSLPLQAFLSDGFSQYLLYGVGILIAVMIGRIINGGGRAITSVCMGLVPAMALLYLGACAVLLYQNRPFLLPALSTIIKSAFNFKSIGAGALGGTLQLALRYGVARGLFTNEAGLGSAAVAASDSTSDNQTQALVSMSATFWDTVVMCAITGLVIVSSLLPQPELINTLAPGDLISYSFSSLPCGTLILNLSLAAFAVATMIGWYYIAEKGVLYIKRQHTNGAVSFFRLVYIVSIFLGFVLSLELVFELSDLMNALLILPNVLSLFLLRRELQPYR